MSPKTKVGAAALLMVLMTIDKASAMFFQFTPAPSPVPEIDGSSGAAAIALLVSIGAILFNRSRSKE